MNSSIRHFDNAYQRKVGKNARKLLHDNSKELVKLFDEHVGVNTIHCVMGIGAGACRNLKYFYDANPRLKFIASDLYYNKEEFHSDMLKLQESGALVFEQMDTLDFVITRRLNPDLLIFSDHLMHLKKSTVIKVIQNVLASDTEYVLIREQKKGFDTLGKQYHECYEWLKEEYNVIYEGSSEQDQNFFIWILQRK